MTFVNRRVVQELVLGLAALFVFSWAVVRACVQSLTIDEADTYLSFASHWLEFAFYPSSNNHVLNSALMGILTGVFGPSSVVVRGPALLGALLYIVICYFLCKIIANTFYFRLILFLCLTLNPFIMDFLVAARGYGLGNALLLAAIAIPVWQGTKGTPSLQTSLILASLALGLSFSANFSFAFADAAALLALLIWAARRRSGQSMGYLATCCLLPGFLVALALCGYSLANWRSNDSLGFGADSLWHMTQALANDSLYQLDPSFAQAGWYRAANEIGTLLLPALCVLCVCQLIVTRLDGSWLQDARSRRLGRFAVALTGIAGLSVLIHWLGFRFFGLPLPLDRKGLYLVSLTTLIAGIVAAVPPRSMMSRWLRRGMVTVFFCLAFYFALCLRTTYFKDWKWDADVKDVYPVLAQYNHNYGVTDVGTSWYYVAPLNYYRVVSGKETFSEFVPVYPYPAEGKPIYVLHGKLDAPFLEKEKLKVVYKGKSTDVVVAINPAAEPFSGHAVKTP